MSNFLKDLQTALSLTKSEISLFTKEKMTELIHFIELDKKDLMEMGFARGPANAIVTHIKTLIPEKVSTQTIRIETESNEEKFKKVCNDFNAGKSVTDALKMFTDKLVLVKSKIDFDQTQEMLAFKGNPGKLWKGNPIVNVGDLDDSVIYLHPRTSRHLQDGLDPITLVQWNNITDEGLCLIAFSEDQGLLAYKDDAQVYNEFLNRPDGQLVTTANNLLKSSGTKLSKYLDRVKVSTKDLNKSGSSSSTNTFAPKISIDGLLSASFGADELRRFLSWNTNSVTDQVNFNNSPANVFFDVSRCLERKGYTESHDFWLALVKERPRRKDEISEVARKYGVNIK